MLARMRRDSDDLPDGGGDGREKRQHGETNPAARLATGGDRSQRSARRRGSYGKSRDGEEGEHAARFGCDRRGPIRRCDPKIEGSEQQRREQSAVGDERADERQPRRRFGHLGMRRQVDASTDGYRTEVARETGAVPGKY